MSRALGGVEAVEEAGDVAVITGEVNVSAVLESYDEYQSDKCPWCGQPHGFAGEPDWDVQFTCQHCGRKGEFWFDYLDNIEPIVELCVSRIDAREVTP